MQENRMTRLNDLLTALGVGHTREVLAEHWDPSESTFPVERPRFLEPKIITKTREFARLPSEVDPELHEAARRISASPELLHLAWHCHCLVYEHLAEGYRQSLDQFDGRDFLADLF